MHRAVLVNVDIDTNDLGFLHSSLIAWSKSRQLLMGKSSSFELSSSASSSMSTSRSRTVSWNGPWTSSWNAFPTTRARDSGDEYLTIDLCAGNEVKSQSTAILGKNKIGSDLPERVAEERRGGLLKDGAKRSRGMELVEGALHHQVVDNRLLDDL